MNDLVVFPDAAALVAGHLATSLGVSTAGKVPNPRPEEFIVVRRVGGPRRNVVTDEATLTVECWSDSDEAAHDLAQLARATIHQMVGEMFDDTPVYRVTEFSGPVHLPDPTSTQPRYTFTVAVAMRGAVPTGS